MQDSQIFNNYWDEFMEKTQIPLEARPHLLQARHTLEKDPELWGALQAEVIRLMREPQTAISESLAAMDALAEKVPVHRYTLHFLLIAAAMYYLKKQYAYRGLPEQMFFDIASDLRYKLVECFTVHGIWGTFVAWWYKKILSCDILALGRLEYERATYPKKAPYERAGFRVEWGDPALSIHIPSSGPLTMEDCYLSYKKAFDFFSHDGRPLVMFCDSWLLYPAHRDFLPKNSNILSFMDHFDIIEEAVSEGEHNNLWRVFGADAEKPPAEWPENSGLQRAYKRRVLEGGSIGSGFGVLVFDGDKILR